MYRNAFILFLLLLATTSKSTTNADVFGSEPGANEGYYVFCYFTGGGDSGVHYAVSRDGYQWKALNEGKAIFAPPIGKKAKLTRDPSIARGEDGIFQMVWTVSWDGRSFGRAWSDDLINWKDAKAVPCMENEPTTRNVWAPELFYDKTDRLYYVIWSSTIPGRFSPADKGTSESAYDHRVYYTTTKDFESFAPTKLYFDPGHNVIDACLMKSNETYYLFYKDETLFPEEKKTILVAESSSPTGPFAKGQTISAQNWVEGPSALTLGQDIVVYYDCYRDGKYGAVRSRNGGDWEDVSNLISFPKGTRHGTAFEVDRTLYERLVETYGIVD